MSDTGPKSIFDFDYFRNKSDSTTPDSIFDFSRYSRSNPLLSKREARQAKRQERRDLRRAKKEAVKAYKEKNGILNSWAGYVMPPVREWEEREKPDTEVHAVGTYHFKPTFYRPEGMNQTEEQSPDSTYTPPASAPDFYNSTYDSSIVGTLSENIEKSRTKNYSKS